MSVRRLTAADNLEPAIELLQRFFREEAFETAEDTIAKNTRYLATLDSCGLFISEDQGIAVGVATVSMEFGIEFGWSAEMGDLYVIPEHRGKGVSRSLVAAVEGFLRAKGAAGYQVTVTSYAEEHHAMRRFYSKLEFEDEARVLLFKKLA